MAAEDHNRLRVKIGENYTGNDLLKYFIEKNIQVEHFSEILPSLNDIFIKLVHGSSAVTRSFQKI